MRPVNPDHARFIARLGSCAYLEKIVDNSLLVYGEILYSYFKSAIFNFRAPRRNSAGICFVNIQLLVKY